MLHGEWPSRDFVDLGAPLTYAISAAAQAVFGERQLTEALLMAAAFGLGAVLTLRAGVVLTGSVVLGVAAALIEVLVYPRTYSYPKIVLYAAAAVAFLWYVEPSVSCAHRVSCRARRVCGAGAARSRALHRHRVGRGRRAVAHPSDRYRGGTVCRASWPPRCSSSCCRISSTCRRWTASSRTCSAGGVHGARSAAAASDARRSPSRTTHGCWPPSGSRRSLRSR